MKWDGNVDFFVYPVEVKWVATVFWEVGRSEIFQFEVGYFSLGIIAL